MEVTNGSHNPEGKTTSKTSNEACFEIAIVGAGIIGVMTALGLLHAHHHVTVYEKADDYFEVGAAMAFTGVARECMQRLSPEALEALRRVGEANRHPMNRYWDGFNPASKEEARSKHSLMFEQSAKELDYMGCLRSVFLREMAKALPEGTVKFGKALETYCDSNSGVELRFADGSTVQADMCEFSNVGCTSTLTTNCRTVLACDGIHSKARGLLLGQDAAASHPNFTHKVAYRAIIPIAAAVDALGEDKANNQCAHLGPGGHALSFPVAQWTLSNVFFFLHDPQPWPDVHKTTLDANKSELLPSLSRWGAGIRALADKLPEKLFKWAIFDMADHPADRYAQGQVALVGDAAHASSPFHGAGACMGVEDALVLVTVLNKAREQAGRFGKPRVVKAALQAYSSVRLVRSQWLVSSSRDMGDIYQWRYPTSGRDAANIKSEIESRSRKIWDFNVDGMMAEALQEYDRNLERAQ